MVLQQYTHRAIQDYMKFWGFFRPLQAVFISRDLSNDFHLF